MSQVTPARCFTWDWREQAPLESIAAFVSEMTGRKVTMRAVPTGSDQYAWIVADYEVSDDDAEELLKVETGG